MRTGSLIGLGLMVMMVSGCAGPGTAQTVNRLQATLDLLDQRVAQLEQTSVRDLTQQPARGEPSEALANATIAPVGFEGAQAKTAARAAMKPSTREIQQALKNTGFYRGQVDGKMGPLTREAVREFQRVHGLTVDGIVGRKTWAQLSPYRDLSAESGELVAAETLK